MHRSTQKQDFNKDYRVNKRILYEYSNLHKVLLEVLLAVTAAKFPVVVWGPGEVLSRVTVPLLGVLQTRVDEDDLLLGVDVVLFALVFKIELLLLFIVVLEALTAIGLIG